MARRKRTKFQHEADLVRIAEMYKSGMYQAQIGEVLGLAQSQISLDIAEIKRRWRSEAVRNIDELQQRQLDDIDNLEQQYWESWERSLQDAVVVKTEKKLVRLKLKDTDGADVELPVDEVKESRQRAGQAGDPRFLQGLQWCVEQRCKILGLYAPVRNDNRNFEIDLSKLTDEQLERVAAGEDALQVIVNGYLATTQSTS